jgi:hypothetical protein
MKAIWIITFYLLILFSGVAFSQNTHNLDSESQMNSEQLGIIDQYYNYMKYDLYSNENDIYIIGGRNDLIMSMKFRKNERHSGRQLLTIQEKFGTIKDLININGEIYFITSNRKGEIHVFKYKNSANTYSKVLDFHCGNIKKIKNIEFIKVMDGDGIGLNIGGEYISSNKRKIGIAHLDLKNKKCTWSKEIELNELSFNQLNSHSQRLIFFNRNEVCSKITESYKEEYPLRIELFQFDKILNKVFSVNHSTLRNDKYLADLTPFINMDGEVNYFKGSISGNTFSLTINNLDEKVIKKIHSIKLKSDISSMTKKEIKNIISLRLFQFSSENIFHIYAELNIKLSERYSRLSSFLIKKNELEEDLHLGLILSEKAILFKNVIFDQESIYGLKKGPIIPSFDKKTIFEGISSLTGETIVHLLHKNEMYSINHLFKTMLFRQERNGVSRGAHTELVKWTW